jgi:hypothetical protein
MVAAKDTTMEESVRRVLEAYAHGDFAQWQGLPLCGPKDLSAVFGGQVEAPGRGMLSGEPTAFRVYQVAATSKEIWAWFDSEDKTLLLTSIEPVLNLPASDLLAALGVPELTLEAGLGPHADARQWIWAQRGLTLFVREEAEDGPEIARVCAYRRTTPSDYVENLGAHDRTRYH